MPRIEKEIEVTSKQGLHARPAALFVQIAQKYDSDVTIDNGTEQVNGKSIMGILTLGVQCGTKIKVVTEGEDAEILMNEIEEFLKEDE